MTPKSMEKYLGVRRFRYGKAEERDQVGQVTGLAWTQVGGELLTIEAVAVAGKGRQVKTGSLGDVMQESIQAATTVVRSRASFLGIAKDFHAKYDLHIHMPEGATPKDGPSAGITMLTSLVSLFTQRKVKSRLAMTGEITLRGKVLPVGGIKEKILAAKRANINQIILCEENRKDIAEIKEAYLKGVTFHYVSDMSEVVALALTKEQVAEPKKL